MSAAPKCPYLKVQFDFVKGWGLAVLSGLIALYGGGCATGAHTNTEEPWQHTAAKRYVQQSFGIQKVEVGSTKRFDGFTSVWVWHLPAHPGGFTLVDVADDGKVIRSEHGR